MRVTEWIHIGASLQGRLFCVCPTKQVRPPICAAVSLHVDALPPYKGLQMLGLSSSDVIATASAVIASCALVATTWQVATTRKHNRLSVRPHLDCSTDRTIGKEARLA
jgi:hypothetical protein